MILLVIFISIVLIWSLVYIFCIKRDMCAIKESLQRIKNTDTNIRLTTSTFDKSISGLICEMNEILDQQKGIRMDCERVNREFREGITNISHDLRTPLTSASGYIELIKSGNISEEKRLEYLEIAHGRLISLSHLMSQLFDYTQIIEKKFQLELESVDICELIREELVSCYDALIQGNFEVVANIPNEAILLITDRTHFQRVIQNLIGNVVKHGVDSFVVKISSNGVMTFTNKVADVEMLEVERLFERFYTSDSSRNSQKTGLGLAITKAVVERMNGRIHAWLEGDMLSVEIDMNLEYKF